EAGGTHIENEDRIVRQYPLLGSDYTLAGNATPDGPPYPHAQPARGSAAPLTPVAQHGDAGWRDVARRLEPTVHQSLLQRRFFGCDAPVTGRAVDAVPVLAENFLGNAGRSGAQCQAE